MEALANEVRLKVVSRVAAVENLVVLRWVSRPYRTVDLGSGYAGGELRGMSSMFSLGVRQHLDGQFYSIVGWYAAFDLSNRLVRSRSERSFTETTTLVSTTLTRLFRILNDFRTRLGRSLPRS